ncbi:MAG TPA: bifunctional phosphoribosylaminoimidazolecarboxamide formyltransferase/IMP cyclohydrolase [Candidatus Eisenbacteria bacterium]|nr:bifunctional phosphoribosylaminoimidazolecarboxamide formyltransferase/IMP cyclohydrolase [Candidatus Eisenbacteria bacterium]
MSGRLGVGVSGAGSNLRALVAAADRGELGGPVALVFADRDCPAVAWAAEQGIETALVPDLASRDPGARAAADAALLDALRAAGIDAVVLAGFMRVVGPAVLNAYPDRILNTHPSLLPAFPGGHAVRDALAHGVAVTGCTVHLVDATLDGGPIVAQEAVPILPGDTEATLHDRIRAVEHRLLPRAAALLLAGALRRPDGGRRVEIDLPLADAAVPAPRRALLSVSDKSGLAEFAAGLVRLGFELVSTGGTARALREAELPVTDVAAVTGFPEMLDGRVKTLHPRIHAGILADRRSADHRQQLQAAAIAPFEVVIVNLYPFAAAADREGIELDALIEEIDIGGPSLIRAAAKNHASVAVVTSPDRYGQVLEELERKGAITPALRSALAAEAFAHTAAYDARIAVELPARMAAAGVVLPDWPGLPGASDPYPPTLTIALEKVEALRYGENPHQTAARYRRPGPGAEAGPFSTGELPLQGKGLSYNNVLDTAAAAVLARGIAEPACVIVKHTNPCGAAIRADIGAAWEAALAGDPVSAFGGIVAVTRPVDAALAIQLTSIFLEVVVAPDYDDAALEVLAAKSSLRLLIDPSLGAMPDASRPRPSPTGSIRTTAGAVLVSAPDSLDDDSAGWTVVTRRPPTPDELADLDLAWLLVRGVTSNAIVLVKDRALIGIGSGQTSRVDAARGAVGKARRFAGIEALIGAGCASDAFYPFPDAVEACLDAGVSAFVQPGGSIRDTDAIAAADAAGATMLLTGTRHFRH